ncbi:MAG: DMT family transporter [Promethearchaeota archaeon]
MSDKNYTKGIIYGVISLIFVSLEPIIANLRPEELDSIIYGAMLSIILCTFFFPLMLLEKQRMKSKYLMQDNIIDSNDIVEPKSLFIVFKNNKKLLIYLGINFAVAYVLFFLGYQLAGAINGSLAQKMDLIFALVFGFLINKEKISKTQIFFSFVLFFGLIVAVTQGSFNLIEFNLGVIIMLITVALWMSAHAITRPYLENKKITPFQLIFIRNGITAIILFSSYFIFRGAYFFVLLVNPINMYFFLLMGIVYAIDLYCYYLSLSYVKITKVSILMGPSVIITAIFATIFLSEIFTIYHLIGSIIVLMSIIVIIKLKEKE